MSVHVHCISVVSRARDIWGNSSQINKLPPQILGRVGQIPPHVTECYIGFVLKAPSSVN